MILFEEALKAVKSSAKSIGKERIPFLSAVGKVLFEDIFSDVNMPPFDKAAMDGYACRKCDLKNVLEVIEIIPAGVSPTKVIGPNQCAKIMTGAPVPQGADTVIMVEYTEIIAKNKIQFLQENSRSNICYLAEDVKKDDVVLKKGTLILPKHIPVLASVGAVEVTVSKMPKVAIISTGDELVEPNVQPNPSQIRNTNAYQLIAQAQQLGVEVQYIGIAKDDKESTRAKLQEAMEIADIIIISGAVSMGDFDFVPIVMKELGVEIYFHGVETKPGKRIIYGTTTNKWFIGVPGNPVSSFVQFEMLIKPLIYSIMGSDCGMQYLKLPLSADFNRKKGDRKAFEPVQVNLDGTVKMLEYHGSAHINALSYAQGLMIIEKGILTLKKGDIVDVRPI